MQKYVDLYYNGTPPDNIDIFFLEEKEYVQKYKDICKTLNKICDDDYINTSGYYFNTPTKYYILLKKYPDIECDNVYILNLFHELSHIETMPNINLEKIHENKIAANDGYDFWKEYIAQYEAVNQYQMKIGDIAFLKDKEETKEILMQLTKNFDENIYEIILYSEITSVYIDKIKTETKNLITLLKKVKNKFKSKQDIKQISITDLNKIGKSINTLKKTYYN